MSGSTKSLASPWREVALPTEHGGWSLSAEPAILGLALAPSVAGLCLGVAAMLAFVARTPLKVVLVDRWRGRWLPRSGLAARILAVELAAIAVLGLVAVVTADSLSFWVPLALAVPLVAVELWFDMRSRSRRLIPELAGTIGIGSVAAAIVLADGRSAALAAGLWVVMAARAVAAIPFVRVQLDRFHRRRAHLWSSDLAQLAAVVAVVVAWLAGWIPLAPVLALAAVAALGLVSVRLAPRPAVFIGVQQMVVGLVVVVVTAVAIGL